MMRAVSGWRKFSSAGMRLSPPLIPYASADTDSARQALSRSPRELFRMPVAILRGALENGHRWATTASRTAANRTISRSARFATRAMKVAVPASCPPESIRAVTRAASCSIWCCRRRAQRGNAALLPTMSPLPRMAWNAGTTKRNPGSSLPSRITRILVRGRTAKRGCVTDGGRHAQPGPWWERRAAPFELRDRLSHASGRQADLLAHSLQLGHREAVGSRQVQYLGLITTNRQIHDLTDLMIPIATIVCHRQLSGKTWGRLPHRVAKSPNLLSAAVLPLSGTARPTPRLAHVTRSTAPFNGCGTIASGSKAVDVSDVHEAAEPAANTSFARRVGSVGASGAIPP